MPKRSFDVVVVGAGVGAAAAGALLQRRGNRVLFALEKAPPKEGPVGVPEITVSLRGGVAQAVGEELHLHNEFSRAWTSVGPFRLLFEGERMVGYDGAELARAFGEQGTFAAENLAGLDAAFERAAAVFAIPPPLPPLGFFERRSLKKLRLGLDIAERAYTLPARLHTGLDALAPLASRLTGAPRTPLARTVSAVPLLMNPGRLSGGEAGLATLLRKRAVELGAQVENVSAPVEQLVHSGSRVDGLLLSGGTEVGAAAVVVGLESAPLARLLAPLGRRVRGFLPSLSALRPTARECTWSLTLATRSVPLPLGQAALVQLDGASVLIESAPGGDQTRLLVRGISQLDGLGDPDLAAFMRVAAIALEEAVPFYRRHVIAEEPPRACGERYDPTESALGIGGLRELLPFKNAVLCGPQVFPGFGLTGELLAGVAAAAGIGPLTRKQQILAQG